MKIPRIVLTDLCEGNEKEDLAQMLWERFSNEEKLLRIIYSLCTSLNNEDSDEVLRILKDGSRK